ncbi:protein phosphatase 2C domain-containing protein, partial [Roseisolibacter sp. H3M3-2]|uniref:protein phosphatase 2C domain-containing protein n=1 Tax=Roseisolibacter sp. H3M3-2 TaxID=3031323 RepID=UPI0023DA41F0
ARALAEAVASLEGVADALAGARPGARRRAVHDHLLATAVAAVITRERTVVLCAGDGVWGINGELRVIRAEGNAPAYPAYRLLRDAGAASDVVVWDGPTGDVDALLLATDGAAELLGRDAACVPGTDEPVLPPARWHEAGPFFRNPHALGRYLVRLARDDQSIDWGAGAVRRGNGLLRDDTTAVVLRRRGADADDGRR